MTEHTPDPDDRVRAAMHGLADEANVEPTRPLSASAVDTTSTPISSVRRPAMLIAAAFILLCGGIAAAMTLSDDDTPDVTTHPASADCDLPAALNLLRSGSFDVSYQPAESFSDLRADTKVVLSGIVESARSVPTWSDQETMTVMDALITTTFPTTAFTADRVRLVNGYLWSVEQGPNPLAEPVDISGVHFAAFLLDADFNRAYGDPDRLITGAHPQGLYIACDRTSPAEPVVHSAAGPDDPPNPSIDEILELVGADPLPPTPDCNLDETLELLRSGLPTYDYTTAGSFAAAAANANLVVSGTIESAQRVRDEPVIDGDIDVTVLNYRNLRRTDGGSTEGIARIKYPTFWPSGTGADPLAEPVELDDLQFVAFLLEAPQVGSEIPEEGLDYQLSVEGLYVACDRDTPAEAVIYSAAGPDDPQNPSLDELMEIARSSFKGEVSISNLHEQEQALVEHLISFARGDYTAIDGIGTVATVSFAVGANIEMTRTPGALRSRAGWWLDVEHAFGRDGPFDLLGLLDTDLDLAISKGPHPHCASPALDPPPGVEGLTQIAIQPAVGTIDSCLDWFAVDLYVVPDTGEIHTVTLSLWEP